MAPLSFIYQQGLKRGLETTKQHFSTSLLHKRPWSRLIRFVDTQGNCRYGEPCSSLIKEAYVIQGDIFSSSVTVTQEVAKVQKLLAPLEHVPIFLGIGLNYRLHVRCLYLMALGERIRNDTFQISNHILQTFWRVTKPE